MIDPTLALQTTQPNTGQLLSQVGNIQNQQQNMQIRAQEAGQNQQLNDQKIQGNQLALNQAGQAASDAADVRAATAAATDPNTGQVNRLQLLSTLGKLNPVAAAQTAQGFKVQDNAAQEAAAKLQQAQATAITAHLDLKDKLLQGVSDQATYTNARNIAIQNGINPQEMPPQYDPAFVAQAHAQTLSQQQAFQQQLDTQKEKDAATKALADQPPATKAINIMAIPEAQRTPDQVAFLNGYKQNNDMTKIQPAQVRANVMLQMPTAIEDPNNPGHTVYVTRKNAIGQTTAQDSSVTNPKNTLKDFTSGTDSHTLTAINTAQGHIQQLFGAADALQNGNVRVLNQIANQYGVQTGASPAVTFQAIKTALTGELGKAFSGTSATVAEQENLAKTLDSANSPTQIKDVATTFNHLMDTKRSVLQQQFQQGMNGKPNFNSSTPSSGMVTVQIPGSPPGHIPSSALAQFQKDHPNAQVSQ